MVNLPIDASNYVKRNLGAEETERYDYGSVADFQTAYLEAANNVGYDVTENQIELNNISILLDNGITKIPDQYFKTSSKLEKRIIVK